MDKSFGEAEFKVVCKTDRVQLFIHENHKVAELKKDIYSDVFNAVVLMLGGRKDKL